MVGLAQLAGVSAVSRSMAWAAGYASHGRAVRFLIERWNGRKWRLLTSLNPVQASRLDGCPAWRHSSVLTYLIAAVLA